MRKTFLNETATLTTAPVCSFTLHTRRRWRAQSSSRAYWSGRSLMSILGSLQSGFPSTKHKYEVVVRRLYCSPSTPLTVPSSENNITGDVLVLLDADSLKEIGITTVGQRLSILKHIYHAKLAHNVPLEPDHYVPPCMSPRVKGSRPKTHTYLLQRRRTENRKT